MASTKALVLHNPSTSSDDVMRCSEDVTRGSDDVMDSNVGTGLPWGLSYVTNGLVSDLNFKDYFDGFDYRAWLKRIH